MGRELRLKSKVLELKMGAIRESVGKAVVAGCCSNICWDMGPAGVETGFKFTVGVVNVTSEWFCILPFLEVLGVTPPRERCTRVFLSLLLS